MKRAIAVTTSLAAVAAFIGAHVAAEDDAQPSYYELSQGWSEVERKRWYAATQGSRLLPKVFFDALEVPDRPLKFNSRENMEKYRFLEDYLNPQNPYPVGFAVDRGTDQNLVITRNDWEKRRSFGRSRREPWIGLNCAACHTSEVELNGQTIRIEGGAGLIDFQSFEEDIALSLRATLNSTAKFDRFAIAILGENADSNSARDRLRSSLQELADWREKIVEINKTDLRYGYSRLDAFGHIFNQVAIFTNAENPTFAPSNAPVSFPFLWNVPQHDKVQWNGIADNQANELGVEYEALGRNTGEVIGVFGEVNTNKRSGPNFAKRASSSVFVSNLLLLEQMLETLESPRWPEEVLGPIDPVKRVRGETLFKQQCSSCHKHLEPDQLDEPVVAQMSFFKPVEKDTQRHPAPGTDPAMACNSFERRTASGFYEGEEIVLEDGTKRPAGEEEQIAALLKLMVTSTLVDQAGELITYVLNPNKRIVTHVPGVEDDDDSLQQTSSGSAANAREEAAKVKGGFIAPVDNSGETAEAASLEEFAKWGPYAACMAGQASLLKGYKARPLNGIWATAPYLHNGSIPNLYELLLEPENRTTTFYTGTKAFDPLRVGYKVEPDSKNQFRFEATNPDGSIRWGNFNGGHDYNNSALTEDDRWALVEYMKSL